MSYLVLARKWRPQTFADMVGQQHIARVLTNAIRGGRVAHCFLFTGVRGVGKTSAARILAKALNCLEGPTPDPCNVCVRCVEVNEARAIDVYEIDGASNRGIDEVRQIIENIRYQPAAGRFKIYIIDEVHQVTKDAFNALLKTLEEPPPFAKFILATTEVHRLPETILSRCQRFDFRRIGANDIHKRLRQIADVEGLNITEGALTLMGRAAQGSMRDAQSLLEQVLSFADPSGEDGTVDESLLRDTLGVPERRVLYEISSAVSTGNATECLRLVAEVATHGVDLAALSRELVEHFRNLLVVCLMEEAGTSGTGGGDGAQYGRLMDLTEEEISRLREQVSSVDAETLIGYYRFMVHGDDIVSRSPYPRFDLEVSLVRVATLPRSVNIVDAIEQLQRLERKLNGPDQSGEVGVVQDVESIPQPEPRNGEELTPVVATQIPPARQGEVETQGTVPNPTEWDRLLSLIEIEERVLGSYLRQGKLLEIRADGIKLELQDLYRSYVQKRENMVLLQGFLERYFEQKMTVTVVTATGEKPGGDPASLGEGNAPDIIDEAVRIFGGTLKR